MVGNAQNKLEDVLHLIGCLSLVAVVVLINADILLRFFASRPVQIQFEMTQLYLMPALATLSLARVFRDGGHLALDIVPEQVIPEIVRRLILALSASFFIAVTWMSWRFAYRAFQRGAVEYGVMDWPLGWAYVVVPIGCGALALRLITETFRRNAQSSDT
ncbi:TRAP transporter small permease [Roseinatronobacter alkalisoli]|uniref:TRAP transporter small permease protein n=1 Tax=Roseinatronobacter alkalisoli TaxID=3028235 RepID=A0ABT5TE39_9RHOB|nr:TRAP transporter small permease [Roseinatronobacter sp. HJB301]MDD7973281.1 TRAP transporter small permease [Roseinatronobacter sp. HJB301]